MWIKDKQARLEDVGKRLDEAKEATEKNLGMGRSVGARRAMVHGVYCCFSVLERCLIFLV